MLIVGANAMLEKLCSYAQNQLPDGVYWDPEQSVRDVLSKLNPTNDVCESVLGLNDYLTTAIPNLHQVSRSNLVQVKKNKTMRWLNSLPEDRQTTVVNLAVKERKNVSDKCKADQQGRAAQRQQSMMQAHVRREALKQKKQAEKEKLSQEHLIASSQELFDVIGEIDAENITAAKKKSKKLAVIRTQIQIRKKRQNINIVLTRAKKQRPVVELLEELSDFIRRNSPFSETIQQLRVGMRIKHRFELDGDLGMKWYGGTIVSYNSGEKLHEIVYDNEEEPCFFNLAIDIANNDLLIESDD